MTHINVVVDQAQRYRSIKQAERSLRFLPKDGNVAVKYYDHTLYIPAELVRKDLESVISLNTQVLEAGGVTL